MYPTRTAARSALAGTGLAAALVAPGALAAQRSPVPSGVGGEVYFAHNTSFPEPRMLAGAALTAGSGFLVLRGSGAMNRVTDDVGGAMETPWTLDGDVMLNSGALGQMAGILLGGFAPVGFVGIGKQGIYRADGESPSMANLSWGGGASISLFEGLRINAEARWRTTLSRDQLLPEGFGPGREIKAGLSFGFGAGSGSRGGASRAPGRTSGGSSGGRTGGVSYPSVPASASARRVLDTADDYVGVPYVWGGETPRGFDCSGFVQYVYARNGVRLPRTSRQQSVVGDYVSPDAWALRPGDLMFFATHGGRTVDHVAMYAGNGRMIHSSSSGNGVAFDDLSSDRGQWFVGRMVAARRMITDGTGLVRSLEAALRMREQLDPPDLAPRRRNR